MLQLLHTVGSFSLLIGLVSQLVVLYGASRAGDKPQMIQAVLLLLALGSDALAIILRPSLPPQLVPDLLGCLAGLLLFSPAVNAVRKMLAEDPDHEIKH